MSTNETAAVLTSISAGLSIISGLIILYTYRLPGIANFTRTLLVCLTIADINNAYGNFVGAVRYFYYKDSSSLHEDSFHSDFLCVSQSFLTTVSSMWSFCWTICISYFLYKSIINDITITLKLKIIMHGISWGAPAFITIIAVSMNALGEDEYRGSGPWCWINRKSSTTDSQEIIWMLFCGKLWEIITYVLVISINSSIKYYIYKERRNCSDYTLRDGLRDEDELFCYAGLILVLLRIWGTIRFFTVIVDDDTHFRNWENYILYLQCIGDSGQAFGNFILYCLFDRTVRNLLFKRIKRISNRVNNTIND